MGWIILIVCVFIALGMYSCCVVAKQAEEAAEEMRLKRLLLDSERLTEAAIASDVGRRRGFKDGYEACRDELAEKMKEVADRPKGEWIVIHKGYDITLVSCSNCGKRFRIPNYNFKSERTRWKCCPICLADMRGEDDE